MVGMLMRAFVCVMALISVSLADAGEVRCLVITDLHFNPFHGLSKAEFKELAAAPAGEWQAVMARFPQPIVPLGSDSNYRLLDSALTAAAEQVERPDFILFAGDFMAHDWLSRYNACADQSIGDNPQAYREFTVKVLQFIAGLFQERFPDAAILPTLGNDDAFCQDYWIQPGGDFLDQFAKVWRPLLGSTVDPEAFERSFSSLGCYVADLPGLEDHRLIALNSVLMSKSYCSSYHAPGHDDCCKCTDSGAAPGTAALAWLEEALSRSSRENKTVWLLMHVPPGIDSYTEDKADGKSLAASLWEPRFLDRYLKLIHEYRSILAISFAGHTHMDDFRIARVDGGPVLLHKIVPSVSPVFGNNPAFQVYQVDSDSGAITDWQTHFLDLSHSGTSIAERTWSKEYAARQAYRLSAIDADAASALFQRIRSNPAAEVSDKYRHFFKVGVKPIPQRRLSIYACAVLNALYADYSSCVSRHDSPAPIEMDSPVRLRRQAGGLDALEHRAKAGGWRP
jgi:sphingomyelin phosphodiesterase acid-like 3